MEALTARYGVAETSKWRFEFWNEPDLRFMWAGSQEEYLQLWFDTYAAVKRACPHIVLGGPGYIMGRGGSEWFNRYIAFCRQNGCLPDFFTAHFYPVETSGFVKKDNMDPKGDFGVLADPDALKNALEEAKEMLRSAGLGAREFHITEWNSTTWHRDLVSDTCYKSAYLAKNIAETLDMTDSLGFWTVSDYMSEMFPADDMFHGGLGLITYNGVRKAGFHALSLLGRLGSVLIGAGDGWVAAREGTGDGAEVQVLLYKREYTDSKIQSAYKICHLLVPISRNSGDSPVWTCSNHSTGRSLHRVKAGDTAG